MTSTEPRLRAGAPRMRAEDRRELVLEAATRVFGERGYFGTTTDAVAKVAGVSQPYVVRMFGTKEALFLAVFDRAGQRLLDTFRAAIAEDPAASRDELHQRMGEAYVELLADRGLLLSLMQAFVLGSDPDIGPCARDGFLAVYRLLRHEAGFTAEEANSFLAMGMLLNTLVGLRMAEDADDPDVADLIEHAARSKAAVLMGLTHDARS